MKFDVGATLPAKTRTSAPSSEKVGPPKKKKKKKKKNERKTVSAGVVVFQSWFVAPNITMKFRQQNSIRIVGQGGQIYRGGRGFHLVA
jgi:hypothetical protein